MDVASPAKPDVRDIDGSGLPLRATTTSSGRGGFRVVMPAAVRRSLQTHAHTRHDVEVGGVLVGRACLDGDGVPYLFIEAGVPALAAESRETNITFTAEAWSHIHEVIDRDHADATIVGWYHTHPSFGIFLSEMDLFIQRHFFDLPFQVAIVIDPVANTDGCFVWRGGQPAVGPITIEPDGESLERVAPAAIPELIEPRGRRRQVRTTRVRLFVGNAFDSIRRLDGAQWAALAALVALALVLFGALVVLLMADAAPAGVPTTSNEPASQQVEHH